VQLSPFGQAARDEWLRSADIRREIALHPDELVVMPNHLHGIVWIVPNDEVAAPDDFPIDHPVGAQGLAPLQT